MSAQSNKLNPIQQKIAEGMNPLVAFFSEHTCGEACWEAREDVCRCSCFGKNHGCMRDASGARPERTAKIDGMRYVLKATCVAGAPEYRSDPATSAARSDVYAECKRLNDAFGGRRFASWDTNVRHAPARIRNASKDQLARWPELASYRENIFAIKDSGHYCMNDIIEAWPQLLWVREDLSEPRGC